MKSKIKILINNLFKNRRNRNISLIAIMIVISLTVIMFNFINDKPINSTELKKETVSKEMNKKNDEIVKIQGSKNNDNITGGKSKDEELLVEDKESDKTKEPKIIVKPTKTYDSETVKETIYFSTDYVDDSSMNKGESKTAQVGVNGLIILKYNYTYDDGKLIETEETVVERVEPIKEIIVNGTYVKPVNSAYNRDISIQAFNIINDYRASNQREMLVWSEAIYEAATIRSKEIAKLFDHQRPNGSSWSSVSPGLVWAENIAKGYSTAQGVAEGWISSPGHKANIMNSDYKTMAISAYIEDGVVHWVQLFGN